MKINARGRPKGIKQTHQKCPDGTGWDPAKKKCIKWTPDQLRKRRHGMKLAERLRELAGELEKRSAWKTAPKEQQFALIKKVAKKHGGKWITFKGDGAAFMWPSDQKSKAEAFVSEITKIYEDSVGQNPMPLSMKWFSDHVTSLQPSRPHLQEGTDSNWYVSLWTNK